MVGIVDAYYNEDELNVGVLQRVAVGRVFEVRFADDFHQGDFRSTIDRLKQQVLDVMNYQHDCQPGQKSGHLEDVYFEYTYSRKDTIVKELGR